MVFIERTTQKKLDLDERQMGILNLLFDNIMDGDSPDILDGLTLPFESDDFFNALGVEPLIPNQKTYGVSIQCVAPDQYELYLNPKCEEDD